MTASNSSALACPPPVYGERHAIFRVEAGYMKVNGGATLEDLIELWAGVLARGIKVRLVTTNIINHRLQVLRAANSSDLPNDVRRLIGLQVVASAPEPVVAPKPVAAAPAPEPSSVTPIKPLTQGEMQAELAQRQHQNFLAECLGRRAEEFRDLMLRTPPADRPAPMVQVVLYDNTSYLLTATSRVSHEFGSDHVGMWIDRFKPEEHPCAITENCKPLTRSNRSQPGEDSPKEVIWVRVLEMEDDAIIRHWINECARPGEPKRKRTDDDSYHSKVDVNGNVTRITKEQYVALLG